jgi:hypothetical protein
MIRFCYKLEEALRRRVERRMTVDVFAQDVGDRGAKRLGLHRIYYRYAACTYSELYTFLKNKDGENHFYEVLCDDLNVGCCLYLDVELEPCELVVERAQQLAQKFAKYSDPEEIIREFSKPIIEDDVQVIADFVETAVRFYVRMVSVTFPG